ncbi:hypothetical protein PHYSODRAFT_303925 [Phytophthora sojae]|uniref:Uncharacterized protein n=1 Tax=Phytophthora sojae (strain P6497) TaxID=1094619 RepID=G4ZZ00_PHYSP|nr:hypothetical protein PHYSODRAFT_303925 [Phytophthora sojae]EGZ12183.1 hypothetical protein PHYSODRAFT_303925 [Phytophthora sojae]|eukprot:XP_009532516.1 hypothetical protein PHYSODRAFT_303925 [Phytophthora sojae]
MTGLSSDVTVVEKLTVYCSDETSLQELESPVVLGPLDHITQSFTPITVVFVYRRGGDASAELVPFDRFRSALSRLLDYYPHLTGRLAMDPKDRTPRVEQLGKGVTLLAAECSEPLAAFEKMVEDDQPPRLVVTNLPDGGNALLPPFDATAAGLTHESILAVQHTRFKCGSVSIGFCLRHVICDACGFFQLARDLAELYRGYGDVDYQHLERAHAVKLSTPPHTRSYMAGLHDVTAEEREEALKFKPIVFKELPTLEDVAADTDASKRPTPPPPPPPIIGRVLPFSSSELAALKAEANQTNPGKPLSTFCVLAAHVWQTVYRARTSVYEAQGLTSGEAAGRLSRQLLVPIDLRSRDQLAELPPRYFPNAVLSLVLSLPAAELLNAHLSKIAEAVRDGIQPQNPMDVKKTLRWIVAQPDKSRVLPCFDYEQEGVLVTQWNKFDMYLGAALDVAPALVAQPFTPLSLYSGLAYFMATEGQLTHSGHATGVPSASVDVSLALSNRPGILSIKTPFFDVTAREKSSYMVE